MNLKAQHQAAVSDEKESRIGQWAILRTQNGNTVTMFKITEDNENDPCLGFKGVTFVDDAEYKHSIEPIFKDIFPKPEFVFQAYGGRHGGGH